MKNKIITYAQAMAHIKSNDTIMMGGFLKCGTAHGLIDEILKTPISDLTIIANDTSFIDSDRGKLITEKRVKKAIVTHIGTNPNTGKQMYDGTLDVELVPQGTVVERIHAGGAGLGGILTSTGIGTIVEQGKEIITIDNKPYILEKPLRADVALIYGSTVDMFGNIAFHGSTRNFNVVMAMAADTVIVEAEHLSPTPLNPNEIVIPGIFVSYIVVKDKK